MFVSISWFIMWLKSFISLLSLRLVILFIMKSEVLKAPVILDELSISFFNYLRKKLQQRTTGFEESRFLNIKWVSINIDTTWGCMKKAWEDSTADRRRPIRLGFGRNQVTNKTGWKSGSWSFCQTGYKRVNR